MGLSKPRNEKKIGLVYCSMVSVITTFLAVTTIYITATHYFEYRFISDDHCYLIGEETFCVFKGDWDNDAYISVIASFYETVITIIILLLTIVSAFAYMVVKSNISQHATEEIERLLPEYFERGPGYKKVSDEIASSDKFQQIEINLKDLREDIQNAFDHCGLDVDLTGKFTKQGADDEADY